MFQKKTIVAAVAGALGLAAAGTSIAQTTVGNVQIYGRLYPEFTVAKSSGATAAGASSSTLGPAPTGLNLKSRNSVDASNSRIGFRGTENLGSGLSAIWQIESTVPLDQGGGILATRTSFVGLRGGFGTVKLGNMDTVYKSLGDPIGTLGISSGNFVSTSNIISSRVPFGGSAGSFHLRAANSMLYESPTLGGLQLFAQFAPGGTSGGANDETRPAGDNSNRPQLWSLGGTYKAGAFTLSLGHETHEDFFAGSTAVPTALRNVTTGVGASASSKDKSTRGTVSYASRGTKVSLDLANIEFTESGQVLTAAIPSKFSSYKHATWALLWEQTWGGPWRSTVAYANSSAGTCSLASLTGAACSTNGLNGNMLVLGGEYSFSRRTALFALYASLNNGSASVYRNLENVAASQVAPGTDITQYAIGIRHNY